MYKGFLCPKPCNKVTKANMVDVDELNARMKRLKWNEFVNVEVSQPIEEPQSTCDRVADSVLIDQETPMSLDSKVDTVASASAHSNANDSTSLLSGVNEQV